jgi:chromosome segregation ATPase
MIKSAIALGALFLFGLGANASAQSLFERCKAEKQQLETLALEVVNIGTDISDIDRQIVDLTRKRRELRADKNSKARRRATLERKIKRDQALHKRKCRGLQKCDRLEEKVARLKNEMQPLSDKVRRIREEIRTRNTETVTLNRDVQRLENQYGQLGCDNLQIGQTPQSTFDRCSQLAKDWTNVQNRINQLQSSVAHLRQRYKRIMKKMRGSNAQLARLLKEFRASCSHSTRLADLESMEREQHEYRSIGSELDEMDSKVKRFKMIKLQKASPRPKRFKPTIRPKKGGRSDGKRGGKKKHTLKPVN